MNVARPDKQSLMISLALHAGLVIAFLVLTTVIDRNREDEPIDVVFYRADELPERAPIPEPEWEPEPEPEPEAELEPEAEPEPQVEPEPQPKPQPTPAPERKREPEPQPKPQPIAPPPPQPKPVKTVRALQPEPRPEPKRPKRPTRKVQTNLLGSDTTQAVVAKSQKKATQTGAFGSSKSEPTRVASKTVRGGTKVGSFAAEAPSKGDDTPATTRQVQSAGFGASSSKTNPPSGSRPSATVSTGNFADKPSTRPSRAKRTVSQPPPESPVEVLSKATPVYTQEARDLRVEGEVTLKVTFRADGNIVILELVDGLGHGLDDAAKAAAQKIRFKPARRDGKPVDHTAVVRIVFQLV